MRPYTLTTQKTITRKNYTTTNHTNRRRPRTETPRPTSASMRLDARNHYPQIKHHTPPPSGATTTNPSRSRPTNRGSPPSPVSHHRDEEKAGLLPQGPIVCPVIQPLKGQRLSRTKPAPTTGDRPSTNTQHRTPRTTRAGLGLMVLLRKEVIQPHLPVRLPCYDFVPIADPTFDGSLPEGLGHRLRVLPTFMT
jgi:hypothetical protein